MGGISPQAGGAQSFDLGAGPATSGADGRISVGQKTFNFGANPNTGLAGGGVLNNPLMLVAAGVGVYLLFKGVGKLRK